MYIILIINYSKCYDRAYNVNYILSTLSGVSIPIESAHLDLSSNQIDKIPQFDGTLINLISIDLSDNKIQDCFNIEYTSY